MFFNQLKFDSKSFNYSKQIETVKFILVVWKLLNVTLYFSIQGHNHSKSNSSGCKR